MDVALIITIVLAFIGYVAKYIFDIANYRREKKLELINQRINMFYGPLYYQTIAGKEIDQKLREKFGVPSGKNTLEEQDLEEYRLYMTEVLMPLNLMREKIILENSYLIIENDPPECLRNFVIHVSTLKAVVAKWKMGDFSEHFAMIPFPPDLGDYITNSYLSLKRKQSKLVGK